MTENAFIQIALYGVLLVAMAVPVGRYMSHVFNGQKTLLSPLLRPLEQVTYRLCGVREDEEMRWTTYTFAMLLFSLAGLLLTYAIQRLQGFLPFNPQHFGTALAASGATPMTPDLAFNTAVSFTTNTNWQAYSGESTMSYFTQMVGLATHNFMSAATGIACAVALVRGFARRSAHSIGSFWTDIIRCTLYLLLPICVVATLVLVWQGVPQNLNPYPTVHPLEGGSQLIAQGPIASQEAIKELGTNGGGFFNANSSHPYENPTPLSNFLEMLMIFAIPAGLTHLFGREVGDVRQGWAVFATMFVLFLGGVLLVYGSEQAGNPLMAPLGVDQRAGAGQCGGNMEGKEVRFGITDSSLFATITTDASCGAINCWHDSLTPLAGLVPLVNIELGEVIFGGVGAGLYGMLMFAILAVFIAGLMVGRTPEYVGKKIEQKEVKMAMLAILVLCADILVFTALALVLHVSTGSYWNPGGELTSNFNNGGPHGFSELLYAYSSCTGNNGSAFAGINVNTPYYNLTLGLAMVIGRFLMLVPIMAIAGSLAAKKYVPPSAGTFPTHSPLFVVLLASTVVIVGALTFFPALALGPLAEFLQLRHGTTWATIWRMIHVG